MPNKIVFILNYAPHYRLFIFNKISKYLDADFYFGNIANSSIKKIEYINLKNFRKEFITVKIKSLFWFRGSINLLFKPYKNYILTGDPQVLSNWFILIVGRILGKRVYLWTHGWYGKERGIKKSIKKLYFKLAYKLFLYGNYSKELLIKEGFNSDELIVVFNSLDYETQVSVRSKLFKTDIYKKHFSNDFPVLFYIGRIQESKKLEQILESMVILRENGFNTNLAIIGGIDPNYNFPEIITTLKLQLNVWMIGNLYDEETIANYIYNANVCISPGNIGLTAIHSLVYGTPVITHDNFKNQMPEFESIINNVNGAFFKENDVYDLSKTIENVLGMEFNRTEVSKTVDNFWNINNQISIFQKEIV